MLSRIANQQNEGSNHWAMFDLSNEIAILKTRIRMLEQRRQRIQSVASVDDSNTLYWAQSDLRRIDDEIREAKAQLAEKQGVR